MDPSLEITVIRLRRRLWLERSLFILAAAGAAGTWFYPRVFPNAWAVYVDGKPVVAMRDRTAIQGALDQVRRSEAGDAAFVQNVRIDRANPTRVPVTDPNTARQRLAAAVKLRAARAVIYIDGTAAVALPNVAEANAALDSVKAPFGQSLDKLDVPPSFKEKVEIRTEPADDDLWADRETAIALLRGEDGDDSAGHRVANGDSAWTIAQKYGLTLADLKRLNPGADLQHLRVGDTLAVGKASQPLLTVLTEGRTVAVVPNPFDTEIHHNPTIFVGKRFLKRPGRNGKLRLTYRVQCANGKIVRREVLRRERLAAGRTAILVLGAKPRPGAG